MARGLLFPSRLFVPLATCIATCTSLVTGTSCTGVRFTTSQTKQTLLLIFTPLLLEAVNVFVVKIVVLRSPHSHGHLAASLSLDPVKHTVAEGGREVLGVLGVLGVRAWGGK